MALPETDDWNALASTFPQYPGMRQIITADITRVQTSCGFAVPLMKYVKQRDTLIRWTESKGEEGMAAYRREKNSVSIDELPTSLARQFEETTT